MIKMIRKVFFEEVAFMLRSAERRTEGDHPIEKEEQIQKL